MMRRKIEEFVPSCQFIYNLPLFHPFSAEQLQILADSSRVRFYKKSAVIFNPTETKYEFFYVVQGSIKLFKTSLDGIDTVIDVLTNDSYFGEEAIFDSFDERYNAQAILNSQLLVVPIETFLQLINRDHQFSIDFLKNSLQKQRRFRRELESLSTHNTTERIGCFMLRLDQLTESQNIALPYSKMLLAARLGMQPETFSRGLANLCKQCEIKIKGSVVHIHTQEKITQFVCRKCSRTFPSCKK